MTRLTRATCHPDKEHKGDGLCNTCWQRRWRERNPGRQWQDRNPEESRAYQRAWYQANRDRILMQQRDRRSTDQYRKIDRRQWLLQRYGLTLDDFRNLLVGQAGRCLICGLVPDKELHVDHDHATGKVRGLLCNPCNAGVGHFRDDPRRLLAAAQYLETAP